MVGLHDYLPTPGDQNELKRHVYPQGFVLIQDTRETTGLFLPKSTPKNQIRTLKDGCEVMRSYLVDGDYSIKGFEDKFTIERKRCTEMFAFTGREHEKTAKKVSRFRDMVASRGFVGLVIEATEADLLYGDSPSSVSPETVRQALISFEIRYGVHIFYSKSRKDIRRWILDRAIKFYKVMREV